MQGFYRVKGTKRVGKFEGIRQVPDGRGGAKEVVLLRGERERRLLVAMRGELEAVRQDEYGDWKERRDEV